MGHSLRVGEWKPAETAGTHSQGALALIGAVPGPRRFDDDLLGRATFSGLLSWSAERAGMSDQQIADELPISHGYMSKFVRGTGEAWAKRLVRFMRITGSLAPLQWIADQMGCDVVVRDVNQARIRELEEQLRALKGAA